MANFYDVMSVRVGDCETCGSKKGNLCTNNNGRSSQGCHFRRKMALQSWKHKHEKEYKDAMRIFKDGPEYGLTGC